MGEAGLPGWWLSGPSRYIVWGKLFKSFDSYTLRYAFDWVHMRCRLRKNRGLANNGDI